MRVEVDTTAVVGVVDAVRRAAASVGLLDLPRHPVCEDTAAADAIGALFSVAEEDLAACRHALEQVGELLEVAAVDYAKVEAQATARR